MYHDCWENVRSDNGKLVGMCGNQYKNKIGLGMKKKKNLSSSFQAKEFWDELESKLEDRAKTFGKILS